MIHKYFMGGVRVTAMMCAIMAAVLAPMERSTVALKRRGGSMLWWSCAPIDLVKTGTRTTRTILVVDAPEDCPFPTKNARVLLLLIKRKFIKKAKTTIVRQRYIKHFF
uniref:Uncharacterized protein n=1 Tax=Attheya septentrionalis TaxID=420275 RepID=A0A7S2XKP0_9STRA|mmetsp:Transcript_17574/g.31718  ORF Transcript_17574/g.31718 Transcript_17574/m.31718 type:complete len:108 (+) Transcript_17574:124-447(+)